KVLHLGKFFHPSHGGIETFLMDLARASHAQGVEQGLVVHAQNNEQRSGSADLGEFPFLRYFDRVPSLGSLGYAPISPGFAPALNRALQSFDPDLLYLHLPNPSAFWALASARARRIPWIVHWHADAADREFARIVRALYPAYYPFEQALLRRAAAVVVSSPPYLDGSRALQRWREKCRVVPLGLDPARLAPGPSDQAEALWGGDGRLRVLGLGRLAAYKGFDGLVRAVARSEARLVIAGDGEERTRLAQRVAELGLAEQVRLVGGVSDGERNALLATCDLVCLPSLNRAEAFGISVLEAMALGKPALVSNLAGSGLPWLVRDGQTGWHVPPGDVAALASRLEGLDRQRGEIARAGVAARARFADCFHIDTVASQIIALQREIVGAA
ncbi:MAG: glycosyltransferase, partial [Wenzhouxiangella sp.]